MSECSTKIPCPSCSYDLLGVSGSRCPECGDTALPMDLTLFAEPPLPPRMDERTLTEHDRRTYEHWLSQSSLRPFAFISGSMAPILFAAYGMIHVSRRIWTSAPNIFGLLAIAAVTCMIIFVFWLTIPVLWSIIGHSRRMHRLVPLDFADNTATEHVVSAIRAFRIVKGSDVSIVLIGETHAAIVGSTLVASVLGRGAPSCRSDIHFEALPRSGLGLRVGWHGEFMMIEDLDARVRGASARNITVVPRQRLPRYVRSRHLISRGDPLTAAGIRGAKPTTS